MKILNALERAAPATDDASRAAVHEGLSHPAAAARPDHAAHLATSCGASWGSARTSSTRRGPSRIPQALIEDEIELVVQVNGKKRGDVRVPREADRKAIETIVLADPAVQKHVDGQAVKKVVVVPGRLVNVVV